MTLLIVFSFLQGMSIGFLLHMLFVRIDSRNRSKRTK